MIVGALDVTRDMSKSLLDTTRHMSLTESPTGAEVYFATQFAVLLGIGYVFTLLGAAFIGYATGRWRGDPATRLLVAIAERFHQANSKESTEGGAG